MRKYWIDSATIQLSKAQHNKRLNVTRILKMFLHVNNMDVDGSFTYSFVTRHIRIVYMNRKTLNRRLKSCTGNVTNTKLQYTSFCNTKTQTFAQFYEWIQLLHCQHFYAKYKLSCQMVTDIIINIDRFYFIQINTADHQTKLIIHEAKTSSLNTSHKRTKWIFEGSSGPFHLLNKHSELCT